MEAVKFMCNNRHCTKGITVYVVDTSDSADYNFYCHCGRSLLRVGEVTITEKSPTYRLVMHGLDHQFRYSKTTFDSYDDAKEAAAQASFAWGYPVEVEEVKE